MTTSRKKEPAKDVLLQFAHTTVSNYREITLSETVFNGERAIVVDNMGNDNVKMIGEREKDDDYDYVIALVNKETEEVQFRPVDIYNVAAQHRDTLQLQNKQRELSHISEDQWTPKAEDKRLKRLSITTSFGDTKKMKAIDKNERKELSEGTAAMITPSSSANKAIGVEEITAIKQEEVSSVLPKANSAAILGREVYPISLFVSDTEIESFGDACIEVMSKKYEEFEYSCGTGTNNDFPLMYKDLVDGHVKDRKSCVLYCLCAAMAYFIKVSKGRNSITSFAFKNSPFPLMITDWIREKYFDGQQTITGNRTPSLPINKIEFERLTLHTLAFAMTIDPDNRIYHVVWADYTKIPANVLEKYATALGGKKEALPASMHKTHGLSVMVLRSPPDTMKTPRGRRGRK